VKKITNYIVSGWKAYSLYVGFFLLGGALCFLPFLVSQRYFPLTMGDSWIKRLPIQCWELFFIAGLSLAALTALRGKKPGFDELFAGFRHMGDLAGYLLITLLSSARSFWWVGMHYPETWPYKSVVLTVLSLFGIFLLINLMFTLYLITDRRLSWIQAVIQSWRMILPRWFAILLLTAICDFSFLLVDLVLKHRVVPTQGWAALFISLIWLIWPLKLCIVGAAYLDIAGETGGEAKPVCEPTLTV